MYADPIPPRAFPEILSRVDYDPFNVMPKAIPPAPRVFASAAMIDRARQRCAAGVAADTEGLRQLTASCKLNEPLPVYKDEGGPPDWGGPLLPWLQLAFRNALAAQLTNDVRHRQRAIEAMRLAADGASRVARWTGHEHNEAIAAGRAYDLLATEQLDPADDNTFRGMLWTFSHALDHCDHRACNNHNVMNATGRLAVAAALGHRGLIHDAFYGFRREGPWRYGLIHTFRHDFLADGMQWEGALGYHQLVLGLVCECVSIMERLGIDLWRREWPATLKDEGFDEHRGWGPRGMKSLTAAFDALLYHAFSNGDFVALHDSMERDLRSTAHWWTIFNTAWRVYGEPRYAWALKLINGGEPARSDGPIPPWLQGNHAGLEFVRIECRDYPDAASPLGHDRVFALGGRNVSGCSIFPQNGSAVLRSDPEDLASPSVHLYWGPHWSGHRSPAALHLDIHAYGRLLTSTPFVSLGYRDDRHLTWNRTTIAHNTVTVDERPMFPYDSEGDSIWEYDLWRDSSSDGVLEAFQPQADFKAIRVSNDNVYPGVRLTRTVLLTRDYALDLYTVQADRARQLDWAMHGAGDLDFGAVSGEHIDLGAGRGYQHFSDAVQLPLRDGWTPISFRAGKHPAQVSLWAPGVPRGSLVLARDPVPKPDDGKAPANTNCATLIWRTHTAAASFVALWSFGADVQADSVRDDAESGMQIRVRVKDRFRTWRIPPAKATQPVSDLGLRAMSPPFIASTADER